MLGLRLLALGMFVCGLCAQSVPQEEEQFPTPSMQDLNAIQGSFFHKKRTELDNTLFIDYHLGQTYKIRLRYAMVTTMVFSEPIQEVILGDHVGFSTKLLGEEKQENSNILLVKPLQIGIDSNLTIISKSGKIYSFYIFSTTFTSSKHPTLHVYVSDKHFLDQASQVQQPLALLEPQEEPPEAQILENAPKEKPPSPDDEAHYLKIGRGAHTMLIPKKEIEHGYRILGHKKRAWFCLWLCKVATSQPIKPLEIFNDAHFTYFKFDHRASQIKFPVAYKVVDGYDNPINTRIVGDYLVAEDIADKWTLREGKQHTCIRRNLKKKP
ncbi:ComB9 competence protein [Helicobacter bizzozeronii]|uniref:TrbG/VirB9 family P-type conjugative transfer protein n=1 Tax=Helicobacter bizzozeronii TaxID=56877 RepID=UPI00244D81F1|nr:TrbG/VirB9 family P-type conjugative transfer protein [Helicobacter bizzozeronii]GMB93558.1 ComB9 competence protein [Helicobacter bizzozeronii]